jgi:hypothetical protein
MLMTLTRLLRFTISNMLVVEPNHYMAYTHFYQSTVHQQVIAWLILLQPGNVWG